MAQAAVIAITVNGTARGEFFIHRMPGGRIALRRQDLPLTGLAVAPVRATRIDGVDHVALEGIEGLTLLWDEPTQTLQVTAEPRLLARHVVESPARVTRARRLDGEGAFLNWAIEQVLDNGSPHTPPSLALEAGARLGPALLLHRARTVADAGGHSRMLRLSTTLSRDMPERLLRWTAGDLVASSDELGQGALLGGLSLSTLARLDPYQIRYPRGSVQGQALLPSVVDVYVDGQRVRSERVPAGVFEIRDLATPLGARSVQLLVRDPYGRIERFDQSLYVSQRLLAPGLHDFQYAIGGLRLDTGQAGVRYGPVAYTARHAWGATSGLTLGLRAEGRAGQFSGGGSMVLRVADKGLLSAALATSHAAGVQGRAGLLRHDYQSSRWGLGASLRADSPGYSTLGGAGILGGLRRDLQVYASRALDEGRSIWISHSRQTMHPGSSLAAPPGWQVARDFAQRGTSLGYTAWLRPWGASLRLTASRFTQGADTRHALSAGLVFLLDREGLASMHSQRGSDGTVQSLQWTQPAPALGGWGHDLSVSRQGILDGEATQWRLASSLEADVVRLRAEATGSDAGAAGTLRLSAAGGLSRLGGRWHHSRPLDDGYVLVQVDGLPGVPVSVNGLAAGMTDALGQRFVHRVGAHQETAIEIDPQAVPIDRKLAQLQQRVVLPERGGAVVRFEARPLRAVTAQLVVRSGHAQQPLPQARIRIGQGPDSRNTYSGLQGEFYLEDLPPGTHTGRAWSERGECRFQLVVPASGEVLADLGLLECTPQADAQNRSDGPR